MGHLKDMGESDLYPCFKGGSGWRQKSTCCALWTDKLKDRLRCIAAAQGSPVTFRFGSPAAICQAPPATQALALALARQ